MDRIPCTKTQALKILKSPNAKKYKKITYCPILGIAYLYPTKPLKSLPLQCPQTIHKV